MKQFNLQFFADDVDSADIDTSVEESEVAEPMEVEETDGDGDVSEESTESTEDSTDETEQPVDVNAIAAAARRRAEAEFKQIQAERDAEYASRFAGYVNPITKQPIRSERDYFDALDAQEQLKNEAELREKGVDPALINAMVQNNPLVKQANQFLENAKQQEVMNQIYADVAKLGEFDANIKTFEDVPPEVLQYAMTNKVPLTDAYKVVNYGKMTSAKEEAIRQGAINQTRNKAHLNPMNGVATNDNSVDIPLELRGMWEQLFPDKSYAERKKLYNEQLK